MLERQTHPNGVVAYISPLLRERGIPHGFGTRIGGTSTGHLATLNLGLPDDYPPDEPARLPLHRQLLLTACGCGERTMLRVHQVHAADLRTIRGDVDTDPAHKADGIVTDDARYAASVRTADCVPVLLATRDGRWVAAVHAGWRGVVAGIVVRAIAALCERGGVEPYGVIAAIGPCISGGAFEVGPEVADAFRDAVPDPSILSGGGRPRIDLVRAIRSQMLAAGMDSECIDTSNLCTYSNVEEFFSHRRENGRTGRMANVIAPRA